MSDRVDDTDETSRRRGSVGFVDVETSRAAQRRIPRRELVTLVAYLETGSHKAGAHRLGIAESTSRHRLSSLIRRVGARNVAQAVWLAHVELAAAAATRDAQSKTIVANGGRGGG